MVGLRKGLFLAALLIAALVLAAPVSARPHPAGPFNLTIVPGPASSGTPVLDGSYQAVFDAAVNGDMSVQEPVLSALASIGPGDSLQAAIDAAAPGSVIDLDPGIYYEHDLVVTKPIIIRANQTLGGNPANTTIDARGLGRIFTVENGNTLVIENLTLQNGLVSGNGSAVSSMGGDIAIISSTISNCSATGSGGAIYSYDGMTLILSSTFSHCSATGSDDADAGGAIFSSEGLVLIASSIFTDCSAPETWGGAIESDSFLIVVSSAFTRCSAFDGGALDFYENGALVINSTFTDCTATGNGGAIWYLNGGTLDLFSSSFSGCSAVFVGGAIASAGDITLESDTFTDCMAGLEGGAIFIFNGNLTATSVTFSGCSAVFSGGAISALISSADITNSTFTGCLADSQGGAIAYASESNLTVTSSTFTGCSAADSGGAIFSFAPSVIRFSRFFQNTAASGPAVYLEPENDAANNWWGSNAEPAGSVNAAVNYTPWLVLGITAAPSSITTAQTSTIRTNLTFTSSGYNTSGGGVYVPANITNTFAVMAGSGSVSPLTSGTVNGVAGTTFMPTGTGTGNISATVDDQTVYITLSVTQAPVTTAPTPVPVSPRIDYGADSDDTPPAVIPLMTVIVNIGGDSGAGKATVTGTKLSELVVTGTVQSGTGLNLTAPPGLVYQYINLVPVRYSSITKTVINFTVPQSWLDENHIAPGNIVLYHLTANGWEALPTTVLYMKDGMVYFSAESTGFSLFAISGTPAVATPEVNPTAPREITSGVVQTPTPSSVVKLPVTTQKTAPPPAAPQAPDGSSPFPLIPALIGIGCISLAGGGWYLRRWWIRRQNPALFEEC
ncbi:MAG: PGF-pre-PGF domain-containing protein [Methanoregula sp.]|nr:PGF-pre-PGF domain-containing protein [Methanoregula sp.]